MRAPLAILAATALVGAGLAATPAGAAPGASSAQKATVVEAKPAAAKAPTYTAGKYIVRMAEPPVADYAGGRAGLPATRPAKGKKVNPKSTAFQKYTAFLSKRHNDALAAVGKKPSSKVYDYNTVFNGFAAELTAEQATELSKQPGVLSLEKNRLQKPTTNNTPDFLGLTARGGLWDQLGGTVAAVGKKTAGSGIVVGIVDSGIWPESPSFSDRDNPNKSFDRKSREKRVFSRPAGFTGVCQTGEEFAKGTCNNKLVAAQYFVEGFGAENLRDFEYLSPRDADGHGSHTASTAAGRGGVRTVVDGVDFGTISGMAPSAHVSAYKVCWNNEFGGCATQDSVAAIDQAVEDGVDVINFSIGGQPESEYLDATEVAFLFAEAAGVSVAASAGNSGSGASTLDHPSPWISTVAAGTHSINESTLELGNGETYIGASITEGLPPTSMVLSSTIGAAGADPAEVALCLPDTLDPAGASGKLVVCDRGVNARAEKSEVVEDAGGVGMVLANTAPSSLNGDLHAVPTVHIDEVAGAAVKAYVSGTADPTGAILAGENEGSTTEVPEVAGFSSRGPSLRGNGDVLKPDVIAPGVDVLASYSPAKNGRQFDFLSGTSMSSPHVAGLSALLQQARPDWTPAMVKSALMTTAYDIKGEDNSPFDQGAGHVRPNSAVTPGLAYNSGFGDYLDFLCGTGDLTGANCATPIDPSDLNLASISVGDLAGTQTIIRTVTSTDPVAKNYRVAVDAPAGVDVTVSPTTMLVGAGESKTYTVSFETQPGALLDDFSFGNLTWLGKNRSVRSPLSIRPVALSAPAEISGTGTDGSAQYDVKAGYDGTMTTDERGLVGDAATEGNVPDGQAAPFDPADPPASADVYSVTIPADTQLSRFDLVVPDVADGDDLDLFLVDPEDDSIVALSASGSANEQINLRAPEAGTYDLYVAGYTSADAANGTDYELYEFNVGNTSAGNFTASDPGTVEIGETYPITVEWTGLDPAQRYLGEVVYNSGTTVVGTTVVYIDPSAS